MIRRLLVIAALAVALPLSAWALSGEALEQRVRDISDQLRCPTCQAISVKDSEASFSKQIRAKVRRMLEEGQSEEQIKAFFVSRYGEWILRAPKKEGLGLVLWVLPALAVLGVGAWIVFKAHRASEASHGETTAAAAEPPLSAAERKQIEKDMRRFEEDV